MSSAAVPIDDIGAIILLGTAAVTISVVVSYVRMTRKQVGRFLTLTRLTFALNIIWQFSSVLYFMIPLDSMPRGLPVTVNFLISNFYATSALFLNVDILEAFEVLTHLSRRTTNIFRGIVLLLLFLDVLIFTLDTFAQTVSIKPLVRPLFVVFGSYTILFNNLKTLYLLRLVYLDRLSTVRERERCDIPDIKNRYYRLNMMFMIIFAFDIFAMALWGTGHLRRNSLFIKIGETLSGCELPFYPFLICGIRDLKFDRLEARTKKPTDTTFFSKFHIKKDKKEEEKSKNDNPSESIKQT